MVREKHYTIVRKILFGENRLTRRQHSWLLGGRLQVRFPLLSNWEWASIIYIALSFVLKKEGICLFSNASFLCPFLVYEFSDISSGGLV